ncbi:hypothetical protein CEXT_526351 [Caerostris extrusa]|uniref:Uncharacterized protein n=1 Tax=Caerostris extrusa TaxID=172846 RepID=A0AAV4UTF3_CAEEX|nr:hypothetical protein CEXT_526351 [Caerostris extrusa]
MSFKSIIGNNNNKIRKHKSPSSSSNLLLLFFPQSRILSNQSAPLSQSTITFSGEKLEEWERKSKRKKKKDTHHFSRKAGSKRTVRVGVFQESRSFDRKRDGYREKLSPFSTPLTSPPKTGNSSWTSRSFRKLAHPQPIRSEERIREVFVGSLRMPEVNDYLLLKIATCLLTEP